MYTTTLKELRDHNACKDRYDHLVTALGAGYGDDTLIHLSQILNHNELDDALWALRACDLTPEEEKAVRLFACDCAERVLPLYEDRHPGDLCPRIAIDTARKYAHGQATKQELRAADAAAYAAAATAITTRAADAAYAAAATATRADAAAYAAAATAREEERAEQAEQEKLFRALLGADKEE